MEAVAGVTGGAAVAGPGAARQDMAPAGGFERALARLEQSEHRAAGLLSRMASGEGGNLHRVMLEMEAVRMQFELLMQVRNRLLDAYQEVMRMQV